MDRNTFKKVIVPFIFYIPFSMLLLIMSFIGDLSFITASILLLLGYLTWTFVEYFAHKYPLHADKDKGFFGVDTSTSHWAHHEFPEDRANIVLSIKFTFPILIFLFLIGMIIFRGVLVTFPWLVGVIYGYLYYEIVHLSVHNKGTKWKGPKKLRQHHLVHHFNDDQSNFGVTSRFWDRVFGTLKGSK